MKKKIIFSLLMSLFFLNVFSQNPDKAEQLVNEGIKLHDAGKYAEAIAKYKEALTTDADHPAALYEMSYTYYISGVLDSAIVLDEKLLKMNIPDNTRKQVYVNLGSVYDDSKQPQQAIKTYKQGIKKFPDFYLLYFNLGITQYRNNDNENAMENFQKAVTLRPFHAGSNNGMYQILADENKIPAVLTATMVCIAEKNTKRSVECAQFIQSAFAPTVKSDSAKKNMAIYIPSSSLSEAKENNFSSAELGISLMAASPDIMDKLQLSTAVQKLKFQFDALCGFLDDKKQKGFFWKFYAPFFSDIKKNNYTEVLVNLILQNTENESALWVTTNETRVSEFYGWVSKYNWPNK
ncbi:tetratricopeptide repeat protein [Parafilimonas sp.]|uniref:tetratricopeptide repeat protein n=1 Tax=Parafilimonas sp. TaxID=1969739 RepID=UPI003F7DD021